MSTIDPILVSVYARTFKSITDEMSISVQKTTRSPILCEAKDFVTGLYDVKGQMLEQTENLPILAFSLAPVCKYIIEYFDGDINEGDVIFHNDVFSMGNQNNDVAVYRPIFFEGELLAWSAVKGHQADIGGAVAGFFWQLNHLAGALYISRIVINHQIYGSLGLIPVFMITLYLSWLTVLFGAQIAAYLSRRSAA